MSKAKNSDSYIVVIAATMPRTFLKGSPTNAGRDLSSGRSDVDFALDKQFSSSCTTFQSRG